MARKRTLNLTETELRVMEVIWRIGKVTVGEVVEALAKTPGSAYNTVLTMMTILERKGYLRHEAPKAGRAFVYHAVVSRAQARRNAVGHLLSRFFGGSADALVLNLVQDEELSGAQLKRLRELLKEKPE
jgi:predicted transcriptional regulator